MRTPERSFMSRRTLLRGAVLSAVDTALSACTSTEGAVTTTTTSEPMTSRSGRGDGSRVLLAYFSRAGENYYYGGRTTLTVGNTEVLARMIAARTNCDLYRIEAADAYSDDYEETVARNVREQQSDARPAIAGPLPSIDQYDRILLASPIWNVRAPMIMSTFTEGLDWRGKAIHPVTTYAMSGLGTTERDYAGLCAGATIAEGLAVPGETAAGAQATVQAWLRRVTLL